MQVKALLLAIFWIAFSIPTFARDKIASPLVKNHSLKFVRNGGQLINQAGKLRPELHTRLKTSTNLNVFTGAGLLIYQWQPKGQMYRVEANLIGANNKVQPLYELPLSYTEQYFGKGKDIKAQSYSRIVYPGVYPNIDWVLYVNDNAHLKYDFIVHPGGNPSDIRIRYSGATAISLQKDGSLSVESPMGVLGEHAPISYTREGKAVGSRFILADSIVTFAVDDYEGTLVIDPELSWSTYHGGTENDHFDAVSVDAWGNTYVSGYTISTDNIATTGAYQTDFGGTDVMSNSGDAFIARYNCSGEVVWATYYGGEAGERAWNVKADAFGNIYVAGFTNLLSGLPSTDNLATEGSHQDSPGGSDGDAFLAKFDSSGNRIWATYYGGSGREGSATIPVGLALDNDGHVYLCGTTNSSDNIATALSHQSAITGGNDAFLAQFDTAGVRQWATYYGGTGNDRGEAVTCDAEGNVYMSGLSNSATGISTTGAHQSTSGGGNDAFLVKFNVDGVRQWATYYGGTGTTDQGMSLYADTAGNIYMGGRTNSSNGISSTGSHQTTYGGGMYDAFLVKFDGTGSRQWGTYFGGLNIGAVSGYNALTGDQSGNIFMTGIARSTDSLSTEGSFQETVNGADDGFIAKFTSEGALDWATYYGGAGTENFSSIATDHLGNLYIGGSTTSDAAFATLGSAQDALSGGYDAFLLRFSDTSYIQPIDTVHGNMVVCAGTEQTYSVYPVPGAIGYTWILPSGWSGASDSSSITITVNDTSGTVSATPVFPCADGSAYSISIEVVRAVITTLTDTVGCTGDTLQLDANVAFGYTWQWMQDGMEIAGATDSSLPVSVSGSYNVVVMKEGCSDTSTAISITIHPLPIIAITVSGDTLKATTGYASYQWSFEGTDIAGAVSDIYLPVVDGSYVVSVTDTNGCSALSESVSFEKPTGIFDIALLNSIHIYPNPATELVYIDAGQKLTGRLTTVDGRLVAGVDAPGKLDISNLPSGMYVLMLYAPDGGLVKAYKLVKSTGY